MSAVAISVEIDGIRHGWASATLRSGEESYWMNGFSYTTDAFADLLRFGVDVALDAYHASILFDGEPTGWAWTYAKSWDPRTGVVSTFRIEELNDFYDPATERREAFVRPIDGDVLAHAILAAVSRIRTEMGVEGFEAAWLHPFPVRGVAALEAALSVVRRREPDHGEPVATVLIVDETDE